MPTVPSIAALGVWKMAQTCSRCGLINPDTASRCDCGFRFAGIPKKPNYPDFSLAADQRKPDSPRSKGCDPYSRAPSDRKANPQSAGCVFLVALFVFLPAIAGYASAVLAFLGGYEKFLAGMVLAGMLLGLILGSLVYLGVRRSTTKTRAPAGHKPRNSRRLGWLLKCIGVMILVAAYPITSYEFWDKGQVLRNPLPLVQLLNFLFIALYSLGFGLVLRGYQYSVRIFEPGSHADGRAPALYLRGFDSDGHVSLQPDSGLARFHGIRAKWDIAGGQAESWDMSKKENRGFSFLNPIIAIRMFFDIGVESAAEVLSRAFRGVGPLVAIGRPGDELALPGADQMFVTDDQWKQVVLGYLDQCSAVVVQVSNSPGFLWELDQVMRRVPRHRVLFLVDFRGKWEEYPRFRDMVKASYAVDFPFYIGHSTFVYFEADGTPRVQEVCLQSPILWPMTGNAVDIRNTFRSFIQGIDGGPRQPPCEPKNYDGQVAVSLLAPAALLLALLYFVFSRHF
jgi:hypothetical protein